MRIRLVLALAATVAALTATAGAASPAPARGAAHQVGSLQAPPTGDECVALTGGRCLTPAQLSAAYDLDGLRAAGTNGTGVTIGIVDSFGSPTLAHDLAVYDEHYGLPPIDLQVITPAGKPPAFDRHDSDMAGWAGETTLDVEVAHTIAPGAKIVLIATPTSETEGITGFPNIITAENYAISHHLVDILSQSFAATEATFTSPAQVRQLSAQVYPAARAAGVTVLSSSGDNGPTDVMLDAKTLYRMPQVDWPASDPLVTAVGGTMLDVGPGGARQSPDAAWGGQPGGGAAGGGLSGVFARPPFQSAIAAIAGEHRAVPDISLDASPSSGLITYGSYGGGGWSVGGGTSQAAPLLAGIVALADQRAHGRAGYLNDVLYGTLARQPGGGVVDVTRGSNDLSDPANDVPGYPASAGYDLATGLGTVDGGAFVQALTTAVAGRTLPLTSQAPTAPTGASAVPSTPTETAPAPRADLVPGADGGRPAKGHVKAIAEIAILVLLAAVAAGVAAVARARRRGDG